ncbi:MAG: hypothetical protein Ta2E_00940 [Mycoplasmoidaceae bacterium]|nr:MAG: hypothetical protein Ta2E_00940 [Mycoplasmoidaceae bacterium]
MILRGLSINILVIHKLLLVFLLIMTNVAKENSPKIPPIIWSFIFHLINLTWNIFKLIYFSYRLLFSLIKWQNISAESRFIDYLKETMWKFQNSSYALIRKKLLKKQNLIIYCYIRSEYWWEYTVRNSFNNNIDIRSTISRREWKTWKKWEKMKEEKLKNWKK